MRIKIIKNSNDFKLLKNEWFTLCEVANHKSLFQSFDFNYFSWIYELNNSVNKLSIVVVYDEEIIKAIFPFYIDCRKKVRFINDDHADFCDYISNDFDDINIVVKLICSEFRVNFFSLINLKSDANLLALNRSIYIKNLNVKSSAYSVLELVKGDFPNNSNKYRSKQKTEFRRINKKNLNKEHVIISCNNIAFPSKLIFLLRKEMIDSGLRSKNFLPKSQLKLIEELYRKDKIIISAVKSDSKIHAISFIVKDIDEYLIWIDLYDSSIMVNIFNYISLFTSLSLNESVKFNFGRGNYPYKKANFLPQTFCLNSLFIFPSVAKKWRFIFESFIIDLIKKIYKKIKT